MPDTRTHLSDRRGRRPARLVAALALSAACAAPQTEQVDLLIVGALLTDGSGEAPRRADLAVRDGRILSVGELSGWSAERTVDAAGLVLAPGFIDLHSHADVILLGDRATQERLLEAKIRQGVTTVVVGNCGLGVAPADESAAAILRDVNAWMTPEGVTAAALDTAGYLASLERQGVALNVGTLVPHGPLRISAMGLAAGAPTAEQSAAMRRDLAAGIDAGALGLSVGLIYPPGMFSATEELIELAHVVARSDGLFTVHVRGSSELLLPATRELIEIARSSGVRTHHSHLEAVGERFWSDAVRVLALEDAARAEGLRISHDVFPYDRAATMMAAIFPPWSLESGVPALLDRLRDPSTRERIRRDVALRTPDWPPWRPGGWPHNLVGAVGWDGILVASTELPGHAPLTGLDLATIAEGSGRDPFDVVADLMLAESGRVGQLVAEISGGPGNREALASIYRHPAAAIVSDAEDYGRGVPHPAHAGAFVRALRLGREERHEPIEARIRRMTGYPAEIAGLALRGRLRAGAPADLVLFDPERVTDRATWESPRLFAEGIVLVAINGQIVVDDGAYLGGLPGTVLRRGAETARVSAVDSELARFSD